MRWNIIVECVREDGKQSTITLSTIERLAGRTTVAMPFISGISLYVQKLGIPLIKGIATRSTSSEKWPRTQRIGLR